MGKKNIPVGATYSPKACTQRTKVFWFTPPFRYQIPLKLSFAESPPGGYDHNAEQRAEWNLQSCEDGIQFCVLGVEFESPQHVFKGGCCRIIHKAHVFSRCVFKKLLLVM